MISSKSDLNGLAAALMQEATVKIPRYCTEQLTEVTGKVFEEILASTPQYFASMVQNWKLTVGRPSAEYHEYRQPYGGRDATPPIGEAGDSENYEGTLDEGLHYLSKASYKSVVYIVNNTLYASEVEDGRGPEGKPIRDVNRFDGQIRMVAYATYYAESLGLTR